MADGLTLCCLLPLQVLLQCCRVSAKLCNAAQLAMLPQVLLQARDSSAAPAALTALAAIMDALHMQHLQGKALPLPITPSRASDDAIMRMCACLTPAQGGDMRTPYAAANAIAAYLRPYVQPDPLPAIDSSQQHQPMQQSVAPPLELLQDSRLQCVLRMLKTNAGSGAPLMEVVEGVPCRTGIFDGPLALASALLGYGGSSDASVTAVQAGLGKAALDVLTSGRQGPLLELSPRGLLALLDCVHHLAQPECLGHAVVTGSEAVVSALLGLLGEQHQGALASWPGSAGGGAQGVFQLVLSVVDILQVPFAVLVAPADAGPYHELLLRCGAMRAMLYSLERLSLQEAAMPINFLSRLVISTPEGVQRFIQVGSATDIGTPHALANA